MLRSESDVGLLGSRRIQIDYVDQTTKWRRLSQYPTAVNKRFFFEVDKITAWKRLAGYPLASSKELFSDVDQTTAWKRLHGYPPVDQKEKFAQIVKLRAAMFGPHTVRVAMK